jgi:acyl dehydratase
MQVPLTHKSGPPGSSPDHGFHEITPGGRGPWTVQVSPGDVARWREIYNEAERTSGGAAVAPPSILYYPSQHMLGRHLVGKTPAATRFGGFARYTLHALKPIPVGSELTITGVVHPPFARRGRGYYEYELEARLGGELVQRHTKQWAFGLSDEEADAQPQRGSEPRNDVEGDAIEHVGPLALTVTVERMGLFEGETEGNSHTDPRMAREMGRPGLLVQGAFSFGLLSRMMTDRFGDGFLAGGMLDVRFIAPAYGPADITAKGEIASKDGGIARLRVWTESADGTQLTSGVASARI